ncbi:MAG TPA: DUF2635 domain-containing protein [Kofleriaceae bacterium]
MKVKPVDPNAVIRDPQTLQKLPPEGGEVPENTFWTRRLQQGDVVRVEETATPTGREPIVPLTTRSQE